MKRFVRSLTYANYLSLLRSALHSLGYASKSRLSSNMTTTATGRGCFTERRFRVGDCYFPIRV